MARPRKEIDQGQFEKLCALQCTETEICDWFDVTDKTLNSWCRRIYKQSFSEVYAKKRGSGKISIRRAQWKLAVEKLNPTMLIWLGRNYLGQRDQPEDNIDMEDTDAYLEAAVADDKSDVTS